MLPKGYSPFKIMEIPIILTVDLFNFAGNICALGSYNNIQTRVESDDFS